MLIIFTPTPIYFLPVKPTSKNASARPNLTKKPSVLSSIGKFVPPPVSPIVMAKTTETSLGPTSKASATSTSATTAVASNGSTNPACSATATEPASFTGWRRPPPTASSPSSTGSHQPPPAFPQRKVPALVPEIEILTPTTVPEPFADFPRLPALKTAPVVEKKLSLIDDEASWLDGDEIDYSQQLFSDSEKFLQNLSLQEKTPKEEQCDVRGAEGLSEKTEALGKPHVQQQQPQQKQQQHKLQQQKHSHSHNQQHQHQQQQQQQQPQQQPSASPEKSPRKIAILKRPQQSPQAPKEAKTERKSLSASPQSSPANNTHPVRSFKTAKARQFERQQTLPKNGCQSTSIENTQQQQPQQTNNTISPKPPKKTIVYSSKTRTKVVIENSK